MCSQTWSTFVFVSLCLDGEFPLSHQTGRLSSKRLALTRLGFIGLIVALSNQQRPTGGMQ